MSTYPRLSSRLTWLCALAFCVSSAHTEEPGVAKKAEDKGERPGWKLVWADEFDYTGAPDPKKWEPETGFLRNAELQYYTKDRRENARVEDGTLIIEARKETFPNPAFNAKAKKGSANAQANAEYTSASLTTAKSASWTYGRIEACAKLPAGRGTWPAIWMLGTNIRKAGWPTCGEIDIMEFVGYDADGVHATVHTGAYNHAKGTAKGKRTAAPGVSENFHIYAVEWTEKALTFFLDDKEVFKYENDGAGVASWPFDKPEYLILNLAIGGGWGGQKGIDESIFPQKFVIDYVRVYQKE